MRSKSLELFASGIPVSQTGFAFHKNAAGQRCHYVWFYPARQSLGDLPYQPPELPHRETDDKAGSAPVEPERPKDPLAEIMKDLRPEN